MKDYPSVGQLAMQLEKRNIQPIFAVTEEVVGVYTVSKIKMTCIHYHLFKENKINAFFFHTLATLKNDSKIGGWSAVERF